MIHELWYTSAPRGLEAGTSGFCVVKRTRDMPVQLRELLEALSAYRHVFPPSHLEVRNNPVCLSHVTASIAGQRWNILSRIQDAGLDHTKRTNFCAQHLAIDRRIDGLSPTRALAKHDTFPDQWDGRSEELVQSRPLPSGIETLRECGAWAAITGDAGWAGEVAKRLQDGQKVYLVFAPGMAMLPLISELFGLLSKEKQWQTTFSTYYANASNVVDCQLRCVLAGSPEHESAQSSRAYVLDLTHVPTSVPDTSFALCARTGHAAVVDHVPEESFASAGNRPLTSIGQRVMTKRTREPVVSSDQPPLPVTQPYLNSDPFPQHKANAHDYRVLTVIGTAFGSIIVTCLVLLPLIFQYKKRESESLEREKNLKSALSIKEAESSTLNALVAQQKNSIADEKQLRAQESQVARSNSVELNANRGILKSREDELVRANAAISSLTNQLVTAQSQKKEDGEKIKQLEEQYRTAMIKLKAKIASPADKPPESDKSPSKSLTDTFNPM